MHRNINPPKTKVTGKTGRPGRPEEQPVERQPPAGAERTETGPVPAAGPPEGEHPAVHGAEPVTNQDEQEKITNADDRGIPSAEN